MSFFIGFKNGFKEFGENIALIVNCILLIFVYILGVGLTALVAKISGKHFLDFRKRKSYWLTLNLKKKPVEEYYRQF